jgi:hypothetical protein
MSAHSLRRYTDLASAIYLLRRKCLTLLNPTNWIDRNDAYYLAQYKERIGARSILALCFAEAPETFHHWSVFSSRSNGVCIEFDKVRLLKAVDSEPSIRHRSMDYREIKKVQATPIKEEDLPFVKRYPFQDEREFRLLHISKEVEVDKYQIPIPLASITRITLSPWMHENLAEEVKLTLKAIDSCEKIKVSRSTLVENEQWKKAAKSALKLPAK